MASGADRPVVDLYRHGRENIPVFGWKPWVNRVNEEREAIDQHNPDWMLEVIDRRIEKKRKGMYISDMVLLTIPMVIGAASLAYRVFT